MYEQVMQSALLMATVRALVAKGVITKLDLLADLERQQQLAPIPAAALMGLMELIENVPAS